MILLLCLRMQLKVEFIINTHICKKKIHLLSLDQGRMIAFRTPRFSINRVDMGLLIAIIIMS